jgi:hypothetical protein
MENARPAIRPVQPIAEMLSVRPIDFLSVSSMSAVAERRAYRAVAPRSESDVGFG